MADQTLQNALQAAANVKQNITWWSKQPGGDYIHTPNTLTQIKNAETQIDGILATKSGVDAQISSYKIQLLTATGSAATALQAQLDAATAQSRTLSNQIVGLAEVIRVAYDINAPVSRPGVVINETTNSTAARSLYKTSMTAIKYNASSVKDAYFRGSAGFLKDISPSPRNTPIRVNSAYELWRDNNSNKGMIQNWTPPDAIKANLAASMKATKEANAGAGKRSGLPPHGFQFQYNPTFVDMQYSGTASVDAMFEASGQDGFNLAGAGVTGSSISIQILINRVQDMKYYNQNTGKLLVAARNVYPIPPSPEDQDAIFKKGTMYDLDYLFKTLLGYTMPSQLRNEETADMGYLGAQPVELHLGKGMRYLVFVNSVNVHHVLFNESMVPLFTTVDISCGRLPDYGQLNSYVVNSVKDKAVPNPANNQTGMGFFDNGLPNGVGFGAN